MHLNHHPNCSQVEIARELEISPAAVAVSLKKLESGGYITRETTESDNRTHRVTITPKGRSVIERSEQMFWETEKRCLKDFQKRKCRVCSSFSNEFMKIFCGISKRRNKDQMKRYGKYIRPCWYAFILGPLLMLTEVAGEVLLPSFMADIINVGAANHDVGYILQKGMIMILTAFIMMAGGVGGAWFASVAAINFGTGLRKDAFKKSRPFRFRRSTGSPRALWLRV